MTVGRRPHRKVQNHGIGRLVLEKKHLAAVQEPRIWYEREALTRAVNVGPSNALGDGAVPKRSG